MGMLQPNQERARGGGGVGSSLKAKRAQINPLNINNQHVEEAGSCSLFLATESDVPNGFGP